MKRKWIQAAAALAAAAVAGCAAASTASAIRDYEKGDYESALAEFQAQSEKDDAQAIFYVGLMYMNGQGCTRQPMEATRLFQKAAYLGSTDAALALAAAFREGLGVKRDYAQALIWEREAAKAGSAQALKNIGDYYYNGWAVKPDVREAAKWYWRSAAKGDVTGIMALAGLVKAGDDGVKADPAAAYVLMNAAAKPANGQRPDRNAAADARNLSHKLTAAEAERAKSMSLEDAVAALAYLDPEAAEHK